RRPDLCRGAGRIARRTRRFAQDARVYRPPHHQVGDRAREPRDRGLRGAAHGPRSEACAGRTESGKPLGFMPRLTVLPHETLCPGGTVIDARTGVSICDNLLQNGVEIEHACEKSCACTTCHVVVRQGFGGLDPSEENEDDMLDKAWGLEAQSRL